MLANKQKQNSLPPKKCFNHRFLGNSILCSICLAWNLSAVGRESSSPFPRKESLNIFLVPQFPSFFGLLAFSNWENKQPNKVKG